MALGLTGTLVTFQEAMNSTLAPVLRKCALFFNNILMYNKSLEEHLSHLEQVLQFLPAHQWEVKMSKCAFAQRKVAYLCHVIGESGVSTDPNKIASINTWPVPTTAKEVSVFLGIFS